MIVRSQHFLETTANILKQINNFHWLHKRMSTNATSLLERARNTIPSMDVDRHKGQAGRIGVFGGSFEYTGAPYFTAISALKVGADLVHVFCPQTAAPVIKSYSPELIVHPLLDCSNAITQIEPWLDRLHVCVIGPGLGRDRNILQTVAELIRVCRQLGKPLIIDADGLYLVTQDTSLVKDYQGVILTPNAIEFSRLFGNERGQIPAAMDKIGQGVTILEKGLNDRIYDTFLNERTDCPSGGSGRRCGGQGDLLCGALATFYFWALQTKHEVKPATVACYAASVLAKSCNQYAFQLKGRSTTCTDMVEQIHSVFQDIFERNKE